MNNYIVRSYRDVIVVTNIVARRTSKAYRHSMIDNVTGILSTKASCTKCDVTSYCDIEYKEIYIPLHHSIEEAIFSEFTRLQFCNKCNNNVFHNCHNNFITYPNILTLVVRRFDNYMHKLTSKLNGGTSLIINDHTYQLKYLIEHHGETINQGHYSVTIEEEGRWLNCNDLVIKHTRLPAHLSNGYKLFYVHM